jgi:hypothetical protein
MEFIKKNETAIALLVTANNRRGTLVLLLPLTKDYEE